MRSAAATNWSSDPSWETDGAGSAFSTTYPSTSSSNMVVRVGTFNEWQVKAIKKVLGFRGLPQNWDSYGSAAITQSAVTAAISLLGMIPLATLPTPRAVPVSGGGIQFEWAKGQRELEVEVRPTGAIEILKVENGLPVNDGEDLSLTEAQIEQAFSWLYAA